MEQPQFKKESFWNLISSEKVKNITIPIIQRAYTQGGRSNDESVEKKGALFLIRLIEALLKENSSIELDFVYGTNENNVIFPLDGQQRLTTLFLLHWYIAHKENKLDNNVKTILKKFTYETRVSSRNFCNKLAESNIEENSYKENFYKTIKNQKWFVSSWENDPSVSSMLKMLDKIDENLSGKHEPLWENLTKTIDVAPITFYYTSLQDFHLTDDLYIKMNARGKELTDFENIKASFNKKIDENEWDFNKELTEKFGYKIDTHWTDLFWPYKVDDKIDKFMLNFMSACLVNYYSRKDQKNALMLFNKPWTLNSDYLDKDSYEYLYSCFETYYNSANKINTDNLNITFWLRNERHDNFSYNDLFKIFISDKYKDKEQSFTWQERIIFYGVTMYLTKNKEINHNNFCDWIRIIRNIISNSTIDSIDTFISAQNLIDELSAYSFDISEYLQSISITSNFAGKQIKEEIQKSGIYHKNPSSKEIIQKLENINFCRGRIDFLLYCLDISNNQTESSSLKKILLVAETHLNKNDISNKFRSALFTIKDHNFYGYWSSWLYLLGETKYCMISDLLDLRTYSFKDHWKEYLKELIIKLCDSTLDEIISSFEKPVSMPNWKWKLISETQLIDKYCRSKYFTVNLQKPEDHCYLLNVGKTSKIENCHIVK